jgi:integrase
MASFEHLPSGSWRGVVRRWDGSRVSKTFPTKTMARTWASITETEVQVPGYREADRMTVAAWHSLWLQARVVAQTTAVEEERRWRLHVQPALGHRMLHELRPLELQRWVSGLPSPSVAHGSLALVQSMFSAAVAEGLMPVNLALGLRQPTVPQRPHRYLSRDEAQRLLAVAQVWRPLVLTALHTGMRWGELCGLHSHRVDITRRRVEVAEVLTLTKGGARVREYPKSNAGRRVLPMTEAVAGSLSELAQRKGLVFVGGKGAPLSRWTWRDRHWLPMLTAAKIDTPLPRFHDLRHTYASWLAEAGVPEHEIQYRMGHGSPNTTRRYMHLAPDGDARVLAALGDLERGSNVGRDLEASGCSEYPPDTE